MHLGNTGPRASRPDHDSGRVPRPLASACSRKPAGVLTVIGLAVLLLSGCASDRATDQRPARETSETTPGLIVGDQATYSANRYASPTAIPTATSVPPATVQQIGLTTGVDGSGQPNGFVVSVAVNAGTVYFVVDLDGLRAGSVVASYWEKNAEKIQDRDYAGGASFTVERDGRQWVALPQNLDGSLAPGNYGVRLFVDEVEIGSIGIELTSAGTQPRGV